MAGDRPIDFRLQSFDYNAGSTGQAYPPFGALIAVRGASRKGGL